MSGQGHVIVVLIVCFRHDCNCIRYFYVCIGFGFGFVVVCVCCVVGNGIYAEDFVHLNWDKFEFFDCTVVGCFVLVLLIVVVVHDVGCVVIEYLKKGNPRVLLMKCLFVRMQTSDFWWQRYHLQVILICLENGHKNIFCSSKSFEYFCCCCFATGFWGVYVCSVYVVFVRVYVCIVYVLLNDECCEWNVWENKKQKKN